MKRAPLRLAAIGLVIAITVTGCDRKPRLVPASADSTSAGRDSITILTRLAAQQWESGQPEQAAALSARVVPGPLATLDLFLSWLREGKPDNARHLLVDPMFLDMALQLGWADLKSPRNVTVDMQEEGQAWPEWLGARIVTKSGPQRWVFHFTLQDGHWLIKDWLAEQPARSTASGTASPDSTGGRKP